MLDLSSCLEIMKRRKELNVSSIKILIKIRLSKILNFEVIPNAISQPNKVLHMMQTINIKLTPLPVFRGHQKLLRVVFSSFLRLIFAAHSLLEKKINVSFREKKFIFLLEAQIFRHRLASK